MATLVQPKIAPPKADYRNYRAAMQAEADWLKELQAQLKADAPGDENAGEVVSFPVADNYARYVVVSSKPLRLIHLKFGDGYSFPFITRLRLSDIAQMVRREKVWNALFDRNK